MCCEMDAEHKHILVLEFKASALLPQQIRRVVGALVAVFRGGLPEDYIATATSNVVLETPLAPARHQTRRTPDTRGEPEPSQPEPDPIQKAVCLRWGAI